MISKKPMSTSIEVANRLYDLSVNRLKLDYALRYGTGFYQFTQEAGAANFKHVPLSEVIKCPKS